MKSILVNPKTQKDFMLIYDLMRKMDMDVQLLDFEEKEELALGIAIKEGMKTENVSEDEIVNILA